MKGLWRILIHGGAGVITRDKMTPELEADFRSGLARALETGAELLRGGAAAMDAAVGAVTAMEENPLFNAGRGSVLTHKGQIEMDAAVMDGRHRRAGALCAVRSIRNPIQAARAIMEDGSHVLLTGDGAEDFARERGLELMELRWFETETRRRQLEAAAEREGSQLDHDGKFGTVGAVVLDVHGDLAAATSTGGMTNKRDGRVGDSPLIGAGTYADNNSLAVSATGQGEAFIRAVAAYRMAAEVEIRGSNIAQAGARVLEHIAALGGSGGLIAVNTRGEWTMPFDTPGMFRATDGSDGKSFVGIYGDENN